MHLKQVLTRIAMCYFASCVYLCTSEVTTSAAIYVKL